MHYYALVLRKTVPIKLEKAIANKLMDRYEKLISYTQSKYSDFEVSSTFEIVHKNHDKINLHYHAMIKSTMPYTLITPPREKGISTYFEECNSQVAWFIYCAKEPYTREKVLEYIDLQNYGMKKSNGILFETEEYQEKVAHRNLMMKLKYIRLV